MKYWFATFLLGVIFLILFSPLVNTERLCYESSKTVMDQISANVFNQRFSKDMECSQSTDELFNLESCIQNATKSSTVAMYANDTIQRMVAIIRPYSSNVWTLKAEHNQMCANSSSYQLP